MPSLIVLHYTAMSCADAACKTLCDPKTEVSAHYLIDRQGSVKQLVDEANRAWHAGAGAWGGIEDVNSHSIGIELCNDGVSPFSAALMDALEGLLPEIMARWSIAPSGVIGHSDCAPGRKIDPGVRFDWQRLAKQGLSIWPEEITGLTPDIIRFRRFLTSFGYDAQLDDAAMLDVFRMRFAPVLRGCDLGPRDMGLAAGLAKIGAVV